MEKVDVKATKSRIRKLEREVEQLDEREHTLYDEIGSLERLLDMWEMYRSQVKAYRKYWGSELALPETQWCVVCGNPRVTHQTIRTCSSLCRQADYRARKEKARWEKHQRASGEG